MRYAVVETKKAENIGIRREYHRLNSDKSRMVVNENELKYEGDPEELAKQLGSKLITRTELDIIMNSKAWQLK